MILAKDRRGNRRPPLRFSVNSIANFRGETGGERGEIGDSQQGRNGRPAAAGFGLIIMPDRSAQARRQKPRSPRTGAIARTDTSGVWVLIWPCRQNLQCHGYKQHTRGHEHHDAPDGGRFQCTFGRFPIANMRALGNENKGRCKIYRERPHPYYPMCPKRRKEERAAGHYHEERSQ